MLRALITLLALAACSPPPEQPDLNTYGALQPLCVFWCRQTLTVTEGDGSSGETITTTISEAGDTLPGLAATPKG
jgi:hypothetical protein